MFRVEEVLSVDTPIYSIDASSHGNRLALLLPVREGLLLTVQALQHPAQKIFQYVFEGVYDTSSLVRFLPTGKDLVLYADRKIYLLSENDESTVELADNVLISAISEDREWFGGIIEGEETPEALVWQARAPLSQKKIRMERFSSAQFVPGRTIYYQIGTRGLVSADAQLITLNWQNGRYHSRAFNYGGAYWLTMNNQSSLLGVIGRNFKGIGLFTWPALIPYLPDVFSHQANGYTRLLLDAPEGIAALSTHIGYVALIRLADGQREFSQQVHNARVRDMVLDRGALMSCADDGRIVRISRE